MTHHTIQMGQPGRRTVLGLGAVAALTFLPPGREAHASPVPDHKLPALSAAGLPLLTGRLRHTTVLQSFGFDEPRGHIYALQIVEGGVRLPGEKTARTHAERAKSGDLCLNRLAMDGSPAGHMYLKGFGHGGALGIEASATAATLWTEWDANPASGYGRGICRFRFTDGRILSRADSGLRGYRPVPGSTTNYAALDAPKRRLLLRYKKNGAPRFALYDLDRFQAGTYRPLLDMAQPGADSGLPFQGMALYGSFAYQLLGSAYGARNPSSSGGNTRLYRIDLRTGRVVHEQVEHTALHLSPREPEGLAVLREGTPRLCLGLTEGPVGGRGFRLYYKALS
ncbi:teichoic acid biosynthesis protein C [Streptomyces sp. NPDC048415]|uniref:phage baseplate protein n=1 Tax=Streptomyces sp. NPDC048415 TaxID=3154822 RepID=UPI00341DA7AA